MTLAPICNLALAGKYAYVNGEFAFVCVDHSCVHLKSGTFSQQEMLSLHAMCDTEARFGSCKALFGTLSLMLVQ